MAIFVDYNGTEYLIVEARGRLLQSRLLTEVKGRGDMLLADVNTGALIIKPGINSDNNLFIHRHRRDKWLRVKMDAESAYTALCRELSQGFMTSYLIRKKPYSNNCRVFAADILKSSSIVKKQIQEMTNV